MNCPYGGVSEEDLIVNRHGRLICGICNAVLQDKVVGDEGYDGQPPIDYDLAG